MKDEQNFKKDFLKMACTLEESSKKIKNGEIKSDEELVETFNQIVDALVPQMKGIPKLSFPEQEVLGVPQRTYGYLTPEIKEKHGIDKLQTSNVNTCLALTGYNENGSFLTHLDECVESQTTDMMERLAEKLGDKFYFSIFADYSGPEYLPRLRRTLGKYSLGIGEFKKLPIQEFRIGITLSGKLYHPENFVKNSALYKEENDIFLNALPSQVNIRENLDCINEMEEIV